MTALNLLPWRERRRLKCRRAFVVGLASSLAVALAVLAVAWHVNESALDAARDRNSRLSERIAALDSRLLELADIERGNAEMETRISAFHRLEAERLGTVRVFSELARTLPSGLRYTALARRGGVISVRGTADSESSVSVFMRNLARSARLGSPSLQNIADVADSGGRAMFDLSFRAATPSARIAQGAQHALE